MGDVLGAIFGSGGKQTTDQTLDPQSQALNELRQQQLSGLFTGTSYSSFAQPRSDIYTGSPAVDALFHQAAAPSTVPSTLTPVEEYGPAAAPNLSNLMSFDDYLNLGLDQGRNYISQVARPEIMQAAALQGLDQGGFVAEAIAKATAGLALPFLQSLPGASTALTLAEPQAALLGGQLQELGAQSSLLRGQLQQTGAQSNLLNAQRGLIGAQSGLLGAQKAATLFPLADYGRGLAEQDLLRQQGVVTTGLTGLPYTPVTDTVAKKSSQPLFNFFGQG